MCLLAGSSSLTRLGSPLLLRSVGVAVMIMFCLLWRATPASSQRVQSAAPYMALVNLVFVYLMTSALWAPAGADGLEKIESVGVMAIFVNLAAWIMSRSNAVILDQLWVVVLATSLVFFIGALVAGPGLQGRYSPLAVDRTYLCG